LGIEKEQSMDSSASNRLRAMADLNDAIAAHKAAVADLGPILDAVLAAGEDAAPEQMADLDRLTAEAERLDRRVQELAVTAGVPIQQPPALVTH
jgi:uncharacterized protein YaaN involved in tellurite resistance